MSNVVNGIIGATVNAVGALNGSVGIGKYIVNDYVLTLEPLPMNDGYTLTIQKGSDVQTVTLEGLSEENLEIFRGYVAAAQAAQLVAESAQTAAETAQGNAEDAQDAAEAAQSLAETAQAAAETAETNAGASATQAGTSASRAAQSATQAAGSAAAAAQTLTDVQAAGQAQIAAIGAEGERVLETIPEDYTALSGDVDLLKAQITTKIGFENIATKTMFSTGFAEYDSSKIASTRRWFVNHVFPAGVHFGAIRFGSTANSSNPDRVQYFEVWTKSGNRLTKVKTVSVDVSESTASQEVHYFEADIDYSAEAECMICLRPTGNPTSMLYTVDASGADNLIVSSDVNADTSSLDYSDLSTFGIKVYPDMEITYTVETKVNVVLIGQGMDYDEIQDAINAISDDNESNPYTLVVMPKGAAYKPFSMLRASFDDTYPWSDVSPRYISIIGLDKKHCVIRSDSGDYNRPCGEPMTNGIIRNLSFVMTNDDQDINATQGGYCLHIDCRTAEDAGYGMVIENCDFENASGPCIGIGTHKNCALTIRRCNMRTTLSANYAPHSGYTNLYNYGVVFCHTSRRSDATGQSITIEDCVGVCDEGSKSLWIAATEEYDPTTASFTYALFRNVFYNLSAGAPAYSISSSLTANPANVGNDTWLKAYVKPSGGIPSTDMSSAVQTSLAKADTALQSAPVSSVAGKTGAVTLDAGDVEYDDQDSYASGTVGAEVSDLKTQVSDIPTISSMSDTEADLDVADSSGNVLVRFADGNMQTKNFNSDNGIYESQFAYTNVSGTETISKFFPKGTRLAFHLTIADNSGNDGIASQSVTYKYTDTSGTSHSLGSDYGYNFPEYTLSEDAASVSVQYGTGLNWGENATLSFKVYSMASFPKRPYVLTVGPSGKQYTSIRAATDYAKQTADLKNRFEIHVYPGTYDTLSYFSSDEIAEEGFEGLTLSNGISLIGIGQRSQIILTATMSTTDYTIQKRNDVSTLNIVGNTVVKNMTIKAENIRYAVHDDKSSLGENTHVFEEVTFYGTNLTSGNGGQISYGAGGSNLKKLYFKNCDFSDGMVIHTSNNMSQEYTGYLENCRARLMNFSDYNSTVKSHFYLKNCAVSRINFQKSGTHDQYMQLEGEGTGHPMITCPTGYVYALEGVHKFDGANVSAGIAVKLNANFDSVQQATSLDSVYGVSIGVANGATYVQTEGWVNSNSLGLSGLSVGDYLTINTSTGAVEVGTSANAIAQVRYVDSNSIAYAMLMI